MGSSILSLLGTAAFRSRGWQPCNVSSTVATILAVFALNYVILFAYFDVVYPSFISPLRHIPRPKWWRARIIYRRFTKTQGEALSDLFYDTPNNGILAVRELTTTRLLVTAPSLLADLLVHRSYDFTKAENTRNFLREIWETGSSSLRETNTSFSKALLCTDEIESAAGLHGGNPEITTDMADWANKVTLDIIGIAGLGRDFNVLQNGHDQIADDYEAIFEPSVEKILYILLAAWFSFPMVRMLPWKMNDLFRSRTTSLRATCKQLIESKMEGIRKQEQDNFDILSVLIQTDNFSVEEQSDQLLTFLAAGHDTTAPALTWSCYLLAVDQARQETLRREIQAALAGAQLGPDNADIGSILERLPFLNAVLNETLRLYPSVPVTIRVAIRDTRLGEQYIPQGTEILVSPWVINRSKHVWGASAETFKPERWIENGQSDKASSNYDFMTFLHGPRSCIGQNFAKAELRCLLAAMALRFSWTLDMDEAEVVPAGAITIKPAKGLRLRLKTVQN
ncbi:cytochrome P450 [Penicillium canariense]|uniref:Cytochrome P450 n=1 Tax=Penicillium canariense TaxID=189055 RepID=A0A9W9I6S7_9EURO|nr:cytochrome P450 [Penicillium canariense]KAJ5168930.1 cytochrome P450 [Penicillium canariense]